MGGLEVGSFPLSDMRQPERDHRFLKRDRRQGARSETVDMKEVFLAGKSKEDRRPYKGGEKIGVDNNGEEIYVSSPAQVGTADGLPVFQYQLETQRGSTIGVAFPILYEGDYEDPNTGAYDGFRVLEVSKGAAAVKEAAEFAVTGNQPVPHGIAYLEVIPSFDGLFEGVCLRMSVKEVGNFAPYPLLDERVSIAEWLAALVKAIGEFGIELANRLANYRRADYQR